MILHVQKGATQFEHSFNDEQVELEIVVLGEVSIRNQELEHEVMQARVYFSTFENSTFDYLCRVQGKDNPHKLLSSGRTVAISIADQLEVYVDLSQVHFDLLTQQCELQLQSNSMIEIFFILACGDSAHKVSYSDFISGSETFGFISKFSVCSVQL